MGRRTTGLRDHRTTGRRDHGPMGAATFRAVFWLFVIAPGLIVSDSRRGALKYNTVDYGFWVRGNTDYGTTTDFTDGTDEMGLRDCETTGLQDYKTTGLRDYQTTGLQDYGTTRRQDCQTSGHVVM